MKKQIFAILALLVTFSGIAEAHYNPRTGRFLSRDPIGEKGGVNTYAFVRNSPIDRVDHLGLNPVDPRTISTHVENFKPLTEGGYDAAIKRGADLVGELTKKSRLSGIKEFKSWYQTYATHRHIYDVQSQMSTRWTDWVKSGGFEDGKPVAEPALSENFEVYDSGSNKFIEVLFGREYSIQVFSCCKNDGEVYYMLSNLIRGEFPSFEKQKKAREREMIVRGAVRPGLVETPPKGCKNAKIVAYIHSHNVGSGTYSNKGLTKRNNWGGLRIDPQISSQASSADRGFSDSRGNTSLYWVDETNGGYTTGHTHGNLRGHGH